MFRFKSSKTKLYISMLCFSICVIFGIYLGGLYVHAENEYASLEAVIPFSCEVSEKIPESEYVIKIEAMDSDFPLPDADSITADADGKGGFTVRVTEPGTYDYLIREIKGNTEDMEYDETVYEAHLFVVSEDSRRLSYSVTVNIAGTDTKPESVQFKNTVKSEEESTETTTETTTEKETEEVTEITTEVTTETDGDTTENSTGKKTDKKTNEKSVRTGDTVSPAILISIACISLILIVCLYIVRKRYMNKSE